MSILLHGDGLVAQVEEAVAELPAALVIFSAVTAAGLDAHVGRSEVRLRALLWMCPLVCVCVAAPQHACPRVRAGMCLREVQ